MVGMEEGEFLMAVDAVPPGASWPRLLRRRSRRLLRRLVSSMSSTIRRGARP